ncbi:MAG TPA: YtxH domain-containing protein [Candidatus Dojkabacteria bacterium]|jgi:gas vesicle protein|nr:YtxH domain-containing protein [Candidatus Dojkabacteria bacterium]
MEHKDGTIYFIAGLLMGGLIGAGVGLIVAPESGEKTIAKLKKEGEKVVKKSLDAVDDFQKSDVMPKVKKIAKELQTKVEKATK